MIRKTIEGLPLNYNIGNMQKFSHQVNNFINPMMYETSDFINNTLSQYSTSNFNQSQLNNILNTGINQLEDEYNKKAEQYLPIFFVNYINQINKDSVVSVKRNLNKFYDNARLIDNQENIENIESSSKNEFIDFFYGLISFYFYKITKKINKALLSQNYNDIKDYLSSQRRITRKKSKFDLQNNYRSTFNAFNKSRMDSNDIDSWQWIYTFRSKTERPYHVGFLKDKIFKNDKEPPIIDPKTKQRGYPGDLINCKCVMKFIRNI